MKVPGSRQRKRLPKAARGGAGPGEPGSSIASYGKRGVESTRAGVADGTVGVGAFSQMRLLYGESSFGHPGPIRLSRPVADDRHRSHVTGHESLDIRRTQCTCILQRLGSVPADFSGAQRQVCPVRH